MPIHPKLDRARTACREQTSLGRRINDAADRKTLFYVRDIHSEVAAALDTDPGRDTRYDEVNEDDSGEDDDDKDPNDDTDRTSLLIIQATSRSQFHPSDPRAMLSQKKGKGKESKSEDNLKVKSHEITYNVSARRVSRKVPTSLVDRGANGGIAGDNVRVIAKTDRKVNISGIDNHELRDLAIVTAGGVCPTQNGEVLVIMHQYAQIPGGQTIHSPTQMESFNISVDDKAVAFGGSQTIETPEG